MWSGTTNRRQSNWRWPLMNGFSRPDRQAALHLPDGRRLAWHEWGPALGRPVLFCTGAAMSGSLAFEIDHVHDLGWRLIAFDRPVSDRRTRTLTRPCRPGDD